MSKEIRKVIRFKDLEKKCVKISRSSVDRWEKNGEFPRRISLGYNSMGWYEDEIDDWVSNRERRVGIQKDLTPEQAFKSLPKKLQKYLLELKEIPGALDRFLEFAKSRYEDNKNV